MPDGLAIARLARCALGIDVDPLTIEDRLREAIDHGLIDAKPWAVDCRSPLQRANLGDPGKHNGSLVHWVRPCRQSARLSSVQRHPTVSQSNSAAAE